MDAKLMQHFAAVTPEEALLLAGQQLDKSVYSSHTAFVMDNKKLMAEGQSIALRPHTRFVNFPAHSHNYVEIIYMLAGSTRHTINGSQHLTLRAGELMMMNQHVRHAIQAAGQGDIAVNFMVLPPFFDTTLELIGPESPLGSFLLGGLQQQESGISYLHFKVAAEATVQNLMENLLLGFVQPAPNQPQLARATVSLLFLTLLNHTAATQMQFGHPRRNTLVVDCLREVEEHYGQANLSAIAARHHVSVTYLSNLVKASTGKTFTELLQEKRLARAAALLQGTHLGIQEVIAAVGYQNTSYFYRLFHRQFGMQPLQYRQEAQAGLPAGTARAATEEISSKS